MKHTEGDWTTTNWVYPTETRIVVQTKGHAICEMLESYYPKEKAGYAKKQAEANAHLIAAAPDLLAACKAQHTAIDTLFAMCIEKDAKFFPSKSGQPWKAIKQGQAVIAKAEKL